MHLVDQVQPLRVAPQLVLRKQPRVAPGLDDHLGGRTEEPLSHFRRLELPAGRRGLLDRDSAPPHGEDIAGSQSGRGPQAFAVEERAVARTEVLDAPAALALRQPSMLPRKLRVGEAEPGVGVHDGRQLDAGEVSPFDATQAHIALAAARLARQDEAARSQAARAQLASALGVSVAAIAGLPGRRFPFLPRHLTIVSSLTIGIPAFFLALAPSSGRHSSQGFLRELARFALPAGTAAGLGVLSSYLFALNVLDLSVLEARTVATTTLVGVGLYLILALEAAGRLRGTVITLVTLALCAGYAAVLVAPFARHFFALGAPTPAVVLPALAGACIAVLGLAALDPRFVPFAERPQDAGPARADDD